jgi:hypothetical protein
LQHSDLIASCSPSATPFCYTPHRVWRGPRLVLRLPVPRLLSVSLATCYLPPSGHLLSNGRHRERQYRRVGRCYERLTVNSAPIPYRSLGIALRFTPNLIKGAPTSGLEPLTPAHYECTRFCGAGFSISGRPAPRILSACVLCFILLDSRRYQRERRCVMRCNKLSLIGDPLVGAAEDQHLKEASRRPFELPCLLRDSSP